MRTTTTRSRASASPAGGFQHCWMRARNASISLCVRLAQRPAGVPSEGVWLSVSPVAEWRCGSRLSSSAAIRLASNLGCGFGGSGFFCGSGGFAFCCVFGSGFLVSFFKASAIGSTLGSGSLAKACFGSDFCAGVGGLGGSGFFCPTCGFGCSTLSDVAAISCFLLTTLAFASSTGFASAIFSTSGFGASAFGAVLMPLVICEKSVAEMMSTGSDSGGVALSGLAAIEISPHARSAACPTADMVHPAFIRSGALLILLHQRDEGVSRRREPSHHAHHCTVIDLLVATHIDALVTPAARGGNRLQLGYQLVDLDLGILQVDLAFGVHRHRERLLVLIERFRLGLRQIQRHADSEQRGRHHEDNEQHEHHVHHRRDVDFRHHGLAPVAPLADRDGCRWSARRHVI